ncbi:MAG: hypothetical protein HZA90_00825 [Verrucomicrobia bacterium]|nr:hypothetical protein [Verrucomicrobiota bacterium]
MNDNMSMPSVTAEAEPPVIPPPAPPSMPTRRRHWWVYALCGAGALVFAGLLVVVALVGYWKSLVRNYTSPSAQTMPVVLASPTGLEELVRSWTEFRLGVEDGTATQPFQLTADDLNQLIAMNPKLKAHARLTITNGQVFGQFTLPLDQVKQRELKGRYLNGLARLGLQFQDGWLTVNVVELKANGKPVPKWILRKLGRENLAKDLDKSQETVGFLQKLDRIDVEGDRILLKPLAKN